TARPEIGPLFERLFAEYLAEKHIPSGYHTERLRNAMLDDLLRFAKQDPWPHAVFKSRMEEAFEYELTPDIFVRGRIDRIDTAPDGKAYVIDYKYSRVDNVRKKLENQSLLQAPLYLMAAERVLQSRPAGVFYVGLRTGLEYVGWSQEPLLDARAFPDDWLENTKQRTLAIVEEIRGGRAAIVPADPDKCAWCDARDVCRVESHQGADVDAAGEQGQ